MPVFDWVQTRVVGQKPNGTAWRKDEECKCDKAELLGSVALAFEDYESLYDGLEAISLDNSLIDEIKVDAKVKKSLLELIIKSIKPPIVEIIGYVEMTTPAPDGVKVIRSSLKVDVPSTPACTFSIHSDTYSTLRSKG